jgi:hypothetical protein
VGVETRLVSWTAITNERRIGNQEKAPKIRRSGSRKNSELRPSRLTQASGLLRLRLPLAAPGRTAVESMTELLPFCE